MSTCHSGAPMSFQRIGGSRVKCLYKSMIRVVDSCCKFSYLSLGKYFLGARYRLGWLVGCFGFNGPLRQYFSLYRAVSQREGEREEKG